MVHALPRKRPVASITFLKRILLFLIQPANSRKIECSYNQDRSANEPTGLQEIQVDNVRVDLGVGSPIQVMVEISGTWPGLCSQLAETRQTTDGKRVTIRLLATPDEPSCPSDHVRLPFEIDIPLNMADKQAGTYTVSVNGKETSFDWSGSMSK